MHLPVIRTAVLPPQRRTDILSRPRLLEILNQLIQYKLFLIIAPAGYGKTSLLADFAHQNTLPVCWYTIGRYDNDPWRFLTHFVSAITQRYPNFGNSSLAFLQDSAQDEPDLDLFVTVISNEIGDLIKEPFAFVLDDYHLVSAKPSISAFTNRLVQAMPDHCHLVIASRNRVSGPEIEMMIAHSLVGGIGLKDLSFSAAEIQAVLLRSHNNMVSVALAEELSKKTEGWITGLLLSIQPAWGEQNAVWKAAQSAGTNLDRFWDLLLSDQPDAIREFLLFTSIFDDFNANLCEAVLGPVTCPVGADWSGLTQSVLHNNLFVLPVGEGAIWLRYHALFRDYLRSRLDQEYPDLKDRILRKLAEFCAEEGEWERAFDIYQSLDDQIAMIELVATGKIVRHEKR